MNQTILVRYGELTLKGKNRSQFINQLRKNVDIILNTKSNASFDSMTIAYSETNLLNLKYIFGIGSYSPTIKIDSKFSKIKEAVFELIKSKQEIKTFKLIIKRRWKAFELTSQELISELAKVILDNNDFIVDVNDPELLIEIDLKKTNTYVFCKRIKGLGGLPVGISGKSLHLISGGIDSPVAALEMMKRGISVSLLSFITPPHTDNKTTDKIVQIANLLNNYQPKIVLYQANYSDLMNYIGLVSNQSYKITLMRRSFYRIAQNIAKDNNIIALSNGENLGQVASQTIESLNTIQAVTNLVIYRPLLTKDKNEIINIAKKIGSYDISILRATESCELFAPKTPITKPNITTSQILEQELNLIFDLEKKCVDKNIKKIYFTKFHLIDGNN